MKMSILLPIVGLIIFTGCARLPQNRYTEVTCYDEKVWVDLELRRPNQPKKPDGPPDPLPGDSKLKRKFKKSQARSY